MSLPLPFFFSVFDPCIRFSTTMRTLSQYEYVFGGIGFPFIYTFFDISRIVGVNGSEVSLW